MKLYIVTGFKSSAFLPREEREVQSKLFKNRDHVEVYVRLYKSFGWLFGAEIHEIEVKDDFIMDLKDLSQ